MSIHINRLIDRIRAADLRQQRDIVISLGEAKDLHADITKLLLAVNELREQAEISAKSEITSIEVRGGTF